MQGLVQHHTLLISSPLEHAAGSHPPAGASFNERLSLRIKQGRVPYGAEIRLVDDDGRVLPSDGTAVGHLLVRGHWIVSEYFGAEWISSITLENAAIGHPGAAEAAVAAIPHEKWQERPPLVVVMRPGAEITRDKVLGYLAEKLPKWWLPDDVAFVAELPHTATGKLQKVKRREMFGSYRFSDG